MADRLPVVPPDGDVIEGEIVTGEAGPQPRVLILSQVAVIARGKRAQSAGRHAAYIGLGAAVTAKRVWESRTSGRYNRWIRKAEVEGDLEKVLATEIRLALFRKERHERRMDWLQAPGRIAIQLPWVLLGTFLVLATLGILLAVARRRWSDLIAPFLTVAHVTGWLVTAFSTAWNLAILAAVPFLLAACWWAGLRHARAMQSGWLAAPKNVADAGVVVTADTIVLALKHLKAAELQRAFKEDWKPSFHLLPVKDGRGYSAVFSVPLGVTAQMIADQRAVLARNLHRAEVEVWPSDAEKGGVGPAGTVSLWVADKGVLSRPAPEYPLLHKGTADVFAGVPGGVSPRGDLITLPVVSNNFVVGGQMGQGKSNACRVVMLGAALDPIAELWVHVLAFNGDFDAYQPRLARYVRGAEDEHVEAALQSLHDLYAEVGRREQRLAELGAKKVTRGLALAHPDLRPRLALFSECHELFGHPQYGEEAAATAAAVLRRARKSAIWAGFDTQSSRKDAIPPKVVELVSVNACFYVKSWRSNDGFLGDGSFAAGIRATELRPGRDRGTSLVTGVSDAQFELLRWYFVEVNDDTGFDAATEVIARAVAKAAPGTITAAAPVAQLEARDLLADVAEVAGPGRVRVADLPARLRELAPLHRGYRGLSGVQLRELLDDEGVRVTNAGNVPKLDSAEVRRVLAERGE